MLAIYQDVLHRLGNECYDLLSYKVGDLPTAAEFKGLEYLRKVLSEGKPKIATYAYVGNRGHLILTTPLQSSDFPHWISAILGSP